MFNYFPGSELFWFTLDSPYQGQSLTTILFGPQIDPERGYNSGAVSDFWNNAMWRYKDVAWAIGETILVAFLGTMGAAIIALPLAFLAAKLFSPLMLVRAATRLVFDFVRGVDALIWVVVLARAIGPGPLTGAQAILITDAGTFGKIFSEALENVDQKQIEGVTSTGAKPLQRYRFGVIPQVVPVLLAQIHYFLESNTRSATIIGAITGGAFVGTASCTISALPTGASCPASNHAAIWTGTRPGNPNRTGARQPRFTVLPRTGTSDAR